MQTFQEEPYLLKNITVNSLINKPISETLKKRVCDIYSSTIEKTIYNSFFPCRNLIDFYENTGKSLTTSFKQFNPQKKDPLFKTGGDCVEMSSEFQKILSSYGIISYIVPFEASALVNKEANKYAIFRHCAIIIIEEKCKEITFTFFDLGLLTPKPIEFSLTDYSMIVSNKERSYQIKPSTTNSDFSHELVISTMGKMKKIRMRFQLFKQWLNAKVSWKKCMRGIKDVKLAKQQKTGENLALIKIDFKSNILEFCLRGVSIRCKEIRIHFDDLDKMLKKHQINTLIKILALYMNLDFITLITYIKKIVDLSNSYKQQIWHPLVQIEEKIG